VLRAPVPETAVHKHGHLRAAKHKVRLPKHWLPPAPSRQPGRAKQRDQRQLRPPVPVRADARHHLGSFCFGKDVGHAGAVVETPVKIKAEELRAERDKGCASSQTSGVVSSEAGAKEPRACGELGNSCLADKKLSVNF